MLFRSVCTVLLASAQLAVGTPVQSLSNGLSTRQAEDANNTVIATPPTCVQGLITPFSKSDLESLRTWMEETDPNSNDFIGKGGWYQWTLGSVKICNYNTNPNGTTDVNLNHKEIGRCLEDINVEREDRKSTVSKVYYLLVESATYRLYVSSSNEEGLTEAS
ncbi:hypothetical protein N0V90_001936 [Kalmusia sp. IMI 367209]|nr:hypothetical protein N0V90_001936 [Kalmusia sp. IMI 367209]